jgi:hypothetical protein
MDGDDCVVDIQSDCPDIRAMAAQLTRLDPMREISRRGAQPVVYSAAPSFCKHAACPVPAGILKAVEVAAGLALPTDVSMKVSRD